MAARRYRTRSEAAGAARSEEAEAAAREMLKHPAIEMLPLTHSSPGRATRARIRRSRSGRSPHSIERFGFTNPVLIDQENTILAGHGRVAAAKLLGMDDGALPADRDDEPRRRSGPTCIADNKLALNAGWDEEILAEELKGLLAEDLDFDIGVTGFSIPEIDSLSRASRRRSRAIRRTTVPSRCAGSLPPRAMCGSSGRIG